MTKPLDLIGKRFERLVVVSRAENSKGGQTRWNCVCDCGGETCSYGSALVGGQSKSCGCLNKERIGSLNKTHGHSKGRKTSKTMNSWRGMKERCSNPNNSHYPIYGGRGISYCERWEDFPNFLEDMGERPDGMTLDRIDVNGDYSPENCRWATLSEQAFNIGVRKDNQSGRTGVKKSKNGKRWIVSIRYQNKPIHLGTYDDFELAVLVREEAELKYFGFIKE